MRKIIFATLAWTAFGVGVVSALLGIWLHSNEFYLTAGVFGGVATALGIATTENR